MLQKPFNFRSCVTGLIVVIGLLLLEGCKEPLPPLKVSIGDSIAGFDVQDLQGKRTQIDLRSGKVQIINIWATWCGPCRHEMPSLDRLSRILGEKHFAVIGISVDQDDHVVREFLIERKISFTNFMDSSMRIADEQLGLRAFPSTFIVGPDGKVLKVIEGWRRWDSQQMVDEIKAFAIDSAEPPAN